MAGYPLRDTWWSRPGWSEYGVYRKHGSHNGLDCYTRRGTVIWATGPGRVVRRATSDAGDFGWWLAVQYDDGHEVLYAHMLAQSPWAVSSRVNAQTRLGQVGDTGNARGNDWVWGSPVPGVALQHVHVEVRGDNGKGARYNPRVYFDRIVQAGDAGTPISAEEEEVMRIIQPHGGDARAAIGPGFGIVFTSWDDYVLFCNVYGIDPNAPTQKIGDPSVSAATARRWFDRVVQMHREGSAPAGVITSLAPVTDGIAEVRSDIAAIPRSGGGATDLKPVLDAIGKVPTAEQNGAAARAAIVR